MLNELTTLPHTLQPNRLKIRPTRYGNVFILLLLGMFVGSINYNNNLGFLLTFLLASMAFGFSPQESAVIAIIGGADGPTTIFLASELADHLLGPVAVAAYSYKALVPIIQPPIIRLLTSKKERAIDMPQARPVSRTAVILFPIVTGLLRRIVRVSRIHEHFRAIQNPAIVRVEIQRVGGRPARQRPRTQELVPVQEAVPVRVANAGIGLARASRAGPSENVGGDPIRVRILDSIGQPVAVRIAYCRIGSVIVYLFAVVKAVIVAVNIRWVSTVGVVLITVAQAVAIGI